MTHSPATRNGSRDRLGKIAFLIGIIAVLIPWGLGLIGVALNVWLGGLILAVAFVLVVYALWIWERFATWHVALRAATILVAAILYFTLVGRQIISEYRGQSRHVTRVQEPPYVPPKGPGIRVEGSIPTPSDQMCGGLPDASQIECLCPRPLEYTLESLPAPSDNNYATELTIRATREPMYKIRAFLRTMYSRANLTTVSPHDKDAVTTLQIAEYDRYSFIISSSAPQSLFKVALHSSEGLRVKCVNQIN